MVLAQNKYQITLDRVLKTQMTFVTHASPSCYVTLRFNALIHVIGLLRKPTRVFLLL